MGRPEDIATLVSYLSRPESDFVNGKLSTFKFVPEPEKALRSGQTITIDGGEDNNLSLMLFYAEKYLSRRDIRLILPVPCDGTRKEISQLPSFHVGVYL